MHSDVNTVDTPPPLSASQKNRSILFSCPLTTQVADTDGKYLVLAAQLAQSYQLTVLLWNEEVRKAAEALSLPYLHLALSTYDVDRIKYAKEFNNLLKDFPIVQRKNAPSWGALLAYDDYVGMVQGFGLSGNDISHPAVFISPLPGGENHDPQDEQVRAALYHWSLTQKIPTIGIEIQDLDTPYKIQRFPSTLTLVKDRENADYTTSLPLSPLSRYLCSHTRDAGIDHAITHEPEHRKSLGWTPGTYYIFLPFHPYYIQEFTLALSALSPYAQEFREAGIHLLITCGQTHRRGLKESEIIRYGCQRWLAPFTYDLVENGVISQLAPLAEAVILPYSHSMSEIFHHLHIPTYSLSDIGKVKDLRLTVRPQEAVSYVIEGGKNE